MERLFGWWTAYHDWAGSLDSEGRFYIIAGCALLLAIYAGIHSSEGVTSAGKESSNPAKTDKVFGKGRRE
jgi:hypothetical protein